MFIYIYNNNKNNTDTFLRVTCAHKKKNEKLAILYFLLKISENEL